MWNVWVGSYDQEGQKKNMHTVSTWEYVLLSCKCIAHEEKVLRFQMHLVSPIRVIKSLARIT